MSPPRILSGESSLPPSGPGMPTRLSPFARSIRVIALTTALLVTAVAAFAQQARQVTDSEYARAERFLAPAVYPQVFGARVVPAWLSGDRFWYMNTTPTGTEFIIIDPVRKTRTPAFDQARIAAALSAATGKSY